MFSALIDWRHSWTPTAGKARANCRNDRASTRAVRHQFRRPPAEIPTARPKSRCVEMSYRDSAAWTAFSTSRAEAYGSAIGLLASSSGSACGPLSARPTAATITRSTFSRRHSFSRRSRSTSSESAVDRRRFGRRHVIHQTVRRAP
jgi:hypothetical protein